MSEPILRRIRELEDRMKNRQETIDYFTTILELRREETTYAHWVLVLADRPYRSTFYSIRAFKGWQTRDRKEKEELEKLFPPIRALRIILTFSIETGTGHEPLYAEVTCDTIVGTWLSRAEQNEVISRICNAVIKLFWIMFDIYKDVTKESRDLWGVEAYEFIIKRARYFQKYATTIYEGAMDNLIKALIKLGGLARNLDEYATRQSILKIGVEFHPAPESVEPRHPNVDVLIEKGRSKTQKSDWVIAKRIVIGLVTTVNILEILDMALQME